MAIKITDNEQGKPIECIEIPAKYLIDSLTLLKGYGVTILKRSLSAISIEDYQIDDLIEALIIMKKELNDAKKETS